MWIVLAVLLVGLFVLSSLLTPKPKTQNAIAGLFSQINFPQATAAAPVPLVFGSVDLKGPNTIYAGNFHAYPITNDVPSGGFGGHKTVIIGYTYFLDLDLAWCLGEGVIFRRLFFDKNLVWVGPVQSGDATVGQYSNPAQFPTGLPPIQASGVVVPRPAGSAYEFIVNDPYWNGGQSSGGGYTGNVFLYSGDFNQLVDARMEQANPGCPSYAGVAHTVFRSFYWGTQNTLPSISMHVSRFPNTLGLPSGTHMVPDPNYPHSAEAIPAPTPSGAIVGSNLENPHNYVPPPLDPLTHALPILGAQGEYDANVMEVVYQILTQPWGGLGLSPTLLDIPSFLAAGQTLFDEQNGCSLTMDTTVAAKDVFSHLMNQIQGLMVQDPATGLIGVKLIRNNYDVTTIPVLDESDITELKNYSSQTWQQTLNQVRVDFVSRLNGYAADFALAQDFANFNAQQRLIATQISMPTVYAPQNALNIAARELSIQSIPLFRVELSANRRAFTLKPGDVFALSYPYLGIVQQIFRVQKAQLGTLEDGTIILSCLQDQFAEAQTIYGVPGPRPVPITLRQPYLLTVFYVEEIPLILYKFFGYSEQYGSGYLACYVSDPGGYSTSFTAKYLPGGQTDTTQAITEINSSIFSNTAKIAAPYGYQDITGFDSYNFLVFQTPPADLTKLFSGATDAQLRQGANLFVLNGELFNFQSYSYDTTGRFRVSGIRRALYDTGVVANATGDNAWFVDASALFSNQLNTTTGQTDNVYLLDQTDQQVMDITQVTPVAVIMNARADRPLPARRLRINDDYALNFTFQSGTSFTVTWYSQDRGQNFLSWEDDTTNVSGIGPTAIDANTYYQASIIVDNTLGPLGPPADNVQIVTVAQPVTVHSTTTNTDETFFKATFNWTPSLQDQVAGFFYIAIRSIDTVTGLKSERPTYAIIPLSASAVGGNIADRTGATIQDRSLANIDYRNYIPTPNMLADRQGNLTQDRNNDPLAWR